MTVEFLIHTAELRKATDQLQVNRGDYKDTDLVDIDVADSAATFYCVGTEAAAPVVVTRPGPVRVPLAVVDKISVAAKTLLPIEELPFRCEPGVVKIGTWITKHPSIRVGDAVDKRLGLPVDLPVLDYVGLGRILSDKQITAEGIRSRIEDATNEHRRAIFEAYKILQPFGVEEQQLRGLVEVYVRAATERLRRSLLSSESA